MKFASKIHSKPPNNKTTCHHRGIMPKRWQVVPVMVIGSGEVTN